jgi:hypothetical protein
MDKLMLKDVWLIGCNCDQAHRKEPKSPCQILIWLHAVSRNERESLQLDAPLGKRGVVQATSHREGRSAL